MMWEHNNLEILHVSTREDMMKYCVRYFLKIIRRNIFFKFAFSIFGRYGEWGTQCPLFVQWFSSACKGLPDHSFLVSLRQQGNTLSTLVDVLLIGLCLWESTWMLLSNSLWCCELWVTALSSSPSWNCDIRVCQSVCKQEHWISPCTPTQSSIRTNSAKMKKWSCALNLSPSVLIIQLFPNFLAMRLPWG